MASERRLVDANDLKTQFDEIPPFIGITCGCVRQYIDEAPTVDAVEVPDAQVRKTVELLCKNYEAAKKKPFVQHPLAYALFHTWKEIDRKGEPNT